MTSSRFNPLIFLGISLLAGIHYHGHVHAFVPPTPTMTSTETSSSTRLYQQDTDTKEKQQKQQPRQAWNVLRFVQQSSKFAAFPSLLPRKPPTQSRIQPGQVLWQPSSKQFFEWAVLDDVIMGGVSASTVDNASGLWKGMVTDANNGGFVGIRSTPNVQLDLTACRGLEWTLAATPNMPRRLKVVVRDSTDFNGIAWTASVEVPSAGNNANKSNSKSHSTINRSCPRGLHKLSRTAPPKMALTRPKLHPFNWCIPNLSTKVP